MNELTIKNELTGLDESKALQIEAVFAPMVEMLKGWSSALLAKIDDLSSAFAKEAVRRACEILNQASVNSEMDGAV